MGNSFRIQLKSSPFCHWCHGRSISPCKATIHQIADFSVNLREENALSTSAIKGYRAAFNIVFFLSGEKLTDNLVIQLLFCNFERACLSRKSKPPAWDVSVVLQSLIHPPYESLKLSSVRHLIVEMCFLLALGLARRSSSYTACLLRSNFQEVGPLPPSLLYPSSWLRRKTQPYWILVCHLMSLLSLLSKTYGQR